ncbi:MAG: hypothetical protein J6Y89_05320, partial [Lachnospiraceae bacterium]|nr:hypothetical protein [Lachnospiraceae bacterium]
MKRFTSILCTLCLVLGMLAGLNLAPTVKASANDPELPGKVTVIDFSDKDAATEWNTTAEIKTATGSAITVGGKTQWTHGVIIIEPQNGWAFKEATYQRITNQNIVALEFESLSSVFSKVRSNTNNDIPDDVKTVMTAYEGRDTSQIKAVYINRALYQQINYSTVNVSFEKNGQTEAMTVTVEPDEKYASLQNFKVGDEFDVFDIVQADCPDVLNGYVRSDYKIKLNGGSIGSHGAYQRWSDTSDPNYGKYQAAGTGVVRFTLTNQKNGVQYVFNANVSYDGMPLNINSFSVGSDAALEMDSFGDADLGQYMIVPKQGGFFTEVFLTFTVPAGVTVNDINFVRNRVVLAPGESKDIPLDPDGDDPHQTPRDIVADLAVEGTTAYVGIQSKNSNVALETAFVIDVTSNGENYEYWLAIGYERAISVSGMGKQIMSVAAGSSLQLKDFLYFRDDAEKQDLYDGITDGSFKLLMQGISPKFENGIFNGELIAYYPCDRMILWDCASSTVIYSGSAAISVKANTLIEAGTSLDLNSLLPGYPDETKWNDYIDTVNVTKVNHDYGYTLKDNNKTFVAPDAVDGIVEYVISSYLAEIKIKVCPAGTLMSSLTDVAKTVEKDESLVVDVDSEDVTLSKDTINNFKENGGDNSSIVLKNSKDKHKSEWHFNKNDLKNAAQKDIKLNVAVGSELVNEELDSKMSKYNIKGMKLGFASNGVLPGKTGLRFYLSDAELNSFADKNKIQMYYNDPATGKLVLESKNLYIAQDNNGDNYIDVAVTHNSDFVLTSADAAEYGESSSSGTSTSGENTSSSSGGSTSGESTSPSSGGSTSGESTTPSSGGGSSSGTGAGTSTDTSSNTSGTGGSSYTPSESTSTTGSTDSSTQSATTEKSQDTGKTEEGKATDSGKNTQEPKTTVTTGKDGSKTTTTVVEGKDGEILSKTEETVKVDKNG